MRAVCRTAARMRERVQVQWPAIKRLDSRDSGLRSSRGTGLHKIGFRSSPSSKEQSMSVTDSRPVSELFADALNQFSKLIRSELHLARAEMSMKASQAMTAIGLLTGAAMFLIP